MMGMMAPHPCSYEHGKRIVELVIAGRAEIVICRIPGFDFRLAKVFGRKRCAFSKINPGHPLFIFVSHAYLSLFGWQRLGIEEGNVNIG
jgi:hypothetical protein